MTEYTQEEIDKARYWMRKEILKEVKKIKSQTPILDKLRENARKENDRNRT